jgi:two-component system OmpR family sensor kinase
LKLQTKLILATASIITAVSVSIGGASVIAIQNSETNRIDSLLSAAVETIQTDGEDPLTAALFAAGQSDIGLTVALVDINGELVVLAESLAEIESVPSAEVLAESQAKAISSDEGGEYRLRTIALPDNEFLVLATSLTAINEARAANLQLLFWFVLNSIWIGAGLIALFIRRDMKKVSNLIHLATEIAEGAKHIKLPNEAGSNAEIDELTRALGHMVDALQHSLWVERDTQQAMQNFLGDASHELRTPLTVVKGYVELLSTENMDEEQRARAFDRVNSEVVRMEALINDLLLLAELGESKPVGAGSVNLSDLVLAAVDDLKVLQPERSVRTSVEVGVSLHGTAELIQQLVSNLFANLRRHTPADTRVSVSLSRAGNLATLTIDDAGPGLPAESYARGINHFQRFDASRSRESGGSGLGMSIMAAVVRQHGGTIELNPSPLGGLQTVINLPL